jgi:hypothetical protein
LTETAVEGIIITAAVVMVVVAVAFTTHKSVAAKAMLF